MRWYSHLAFALVIVLSLLLLPIGWTSSPREKVYYKRDVGEDIAVVANVTTILGNLIPISAGCVWFVTWLRKRKKGL